MSGCQSLGILVIELLEVDMQRKGMVIIRGDYWQRESDKVWGKV